MEPVEIKDLIYGYRRTDFQSMTKKELLDNALYFMDNFADYIEKHIETDDFFRPGRFTFIGRP